MNKKICLSIEQMQKLKELGVDTSNASMVLMFYTEYGDELDWDEVENHGKDKPLYEWHNDDAGVWESANAQCFLTDSGNYDHSYREACGTFTLQDMLEIFPGTVYSSRGVPGCINFVKGNQCYACFSLAYNTEVYNNSIDAAFDMLVWLVKNGYLNTKEN